MRLSYEPASEPQRADRVVSPGPLILGLSLSSVELSNTQVYGPQIRARLETAAHSCKVVVLELRAYRDDKSVDPGHAWIEDHAFPVLCNPRLRPRIALVDRPRAMEV